MAYNPISLNYKRRDETHYLIVHDSHSVVMEHSPIQWLKLKARGMGLLNIGFNFIIPENGDLIETRPHAMQGSHTLGFDRISVGVCLMGGLRHRLGDDGEQIPYHCDTFTEAQRDRLRALHLFLEGHYPGIQLKGHTECGFHQRRLRGPNGFACPSFDIEEFRHNGR